MFSIRPNIATLALVLTLGGATASLTYAQSGGGGGGGGGSSGGSSGGAGGASGGTAGGGPGGTVSPSGGGASTNPSVTGPAATGAPSGSPTIGSPATGSSSVTIPSTGTPGSPSVDPLRRTLPANPSTGVNPQVGVPNATNPAAPSTPQTTGPGSTGGSARAAKGVVIDPLKQCINDWDAGTHITRKRWAEICRDRPKIGIDTSDVQTTPAKNRTKGARAYQ